MLKSDPWISGFLVRELVRLERAEDQDRDTVRKARKGAIQQARKGATWEDDDVFRVEMGEEIAVCNCVVMLSIALNVFRVQSQRRLGVEGQAWKCEN